MQPRKYLDEDLIEAVPQCFSIAGVLRKIGLRPAGGNYATVQRRIKELGLDISHFKGQGWLRGTHVRTGRGSIPLEDLLVVGRPYKTSTLKERLIKEGLKKEVCETCLLADWNGQPIPLELDHINGIRDDNRLANLRVICPNCHAQTPTYRAKNRGNNRYDNQPP